MYPSRRFISLIGFCVVACDEPGQTGGDGSLPTTSTDSSTSDTEVPGVDATELGPVQLVVFDARVAEVAGPLSEASAWRFEAEPGEALVRVELSIFNREGGKPLSMTVDNFKLSAGGLTYAPMTAVEQSFISMSPCLGDFEIEPGGMFGCGLAFRVPRASPPTAILYVSDDGQRTSADLTAQPCDCTTLTGSECHAIHGCVSLISGRDAESCADACSAAGLTCVDAQHLVDQGGYTSFRQRPCFAETLGEISNCGCVLR